MITAFINYEMEHSTQLWECEPSLLFE